MSRDRLSKEELQKKREREKRSVLASRQTYALENSKARAASTANLTKREKKTMKYTHTIDQYVGGKMENSEVDARFASDLQKMKFCRKPVGFIMWLLYVACIALLIIPIVLPDLGLEQFTSVCVDAPATVAADENGEETDENVDEDEDAEDEGAENAAFQSKIYTEGEDDGEEPSDEDAEDSEETAEKAKESDVTYYGVADPIFGWIKFVAGKLNISLDLGESPWYDAQVAKIEVGMTDTVAKILILAFPPFVLFYALLAVTLMVQTLICFASGDRRIFRFTGLENFFMLVVGLIIALGCYATTVEVSGALDFGGIVGFLTGALTGAGGFTAGYGLLIMLVIPVVGFILSFFLLEKKLRGREISQPIIVYHYKEK